jgi:hypothetical protein
MREAQSQYKLRASWLFDEDGKDDRCCWSLLWLSINKRYPSPYHFQTAIP